MTGIELKIDVLVGSIVIVFALIIPAFLISLSRAVSRCRDDEPGGWGDGITATILFTTITYAIFVYMGWDDQHHVAFLFVTPVPITLAVTSHVLFVLLVSKLFSRGWLAPKEKSIGISYYKYTFIIVGFAWVFAVEFPWTQ